MVRDADANAPYATDLSRIRSIALCFKQMHLFFYLVTPTWWYPRVACVTLRANLRVFS
jgi:hypothetical protein